METATALRLANRWPLGHDIFRRTALIAHCTGHQIATTVARVCFLFQKSRQRRRASGCVPRASPSMRRCTKVSVNTRNVLLKCGYVSVLCLYVPRGEQRPLSQQQMVNVAAFRTLKMEDGWGTGINLCDICFLCGYDTKSTYEQLQMDMYVLLKDFGLMKMFISRQSRRSLNILERRYRIETTYVQLNLE